MRFREKKKKRKHSSLDLGISRQKKKENYARRRHPLAGSTDVLAPLQ